ncbi:MAG TPA: phosphoribosyltransferase [Alphaproteobacteria bacterium]|nr:phosphoribosyltransferase [Alphaproteobacteria bacterium]
MFANRTDAGQRLAADLMRFKGESPCVLALPRGGVPVGIEIAKALDAPLDLVLVRKIGAPDQPELAVGAVVDGGRPEVVLNDDIIRVLELPEQYIAEESARQLKEIERRRQVYLAGRPRVDVAGRTALIVDDGIATGATIRAAILATRRAQPKRLILAVPVAPTDTVAALRKESDEVVCLEEHDPFGAIGYYYFDFRQVSDDTVRDLMAQAAMLTPAPEATSKNVA